MSEHIMDTQTTSWNILQITPTPPIKNRSRKWSRNDNMVINQHSSDTNSQRGRVWIQKIIPSISIISTYCCILLCWQHLMIESDPRNKWSSGGHGIKKYKSVLSVERRIKIHRWRPKVCHFYFHAIYFKCQQGKWKYAEK